MVYEVASPFDVRFVQYLNNRNFSAVTNTAAARDLRSEGVKFIAEEDSPTGVTLLVVANEVSGKTTVYEVAQVP